MKQFTIFIFLFLCITYISAIQVSGNQSGNWTTNDNPYQIMGDITIPAGLTLEIEPGVIVEAMGNYQIIAQGNIIALGTPADSIKFGSGLPDQTTLWKGIRLENTLVQSQFRNCRIELGQYGINSINSPVEITFCHFNKNQKGIQSYGIGATEPATVLIDHNLIEFSQHNGILVSQNSNTDITYNDICHNGLTTQYYGAIQLSNQSAGGSNSPLIAYNHIHHNHKQGLIAWDIVSANAIQPEVHDNLVENNLSGIYFRHASGYMYNNQVINNFIPGDMNSGAGFMISGSTAHPYLEDNIITGNFTGFYLTENANPVLGDMSSNNMWAQGGNQIYNNIDANSVMHSIVCYQYTAATFTVKAENNRWDFDTAAQIDATITDFNDNAAFPTIDYEPWLQIIPPIYLSGTIVSTNPQITEANLDLISAQTGQVLNHWVVQCNNQFQVAVNHDSLVYIVARGTDLSNVNYMAAYGGFENPIATQIIADVQFSIGDLTLTDELPNWYKLKLDTPEMINGHQSYPLTRGWFVFAPIEKFWLFRDGDYLRISRYSVWSEDDDVFEHYDIPTVPIWSKIININTGDTWEQFFYYSMSSGTPVVGTASAIANIIYPTVNDRGLYHMINITNGSNYNTIQLYDTASDISHFYVLDASEFVSNMYKTINILVEPDGTLFPLQTGNIWRAYNLKQDTVPTYFGYTVTDSLKFYWIPPRSGLNYLSYKLFDGEAMLQEMPLSNQQISAPIQYDGLEHTYSLSAWNGTTNSFAESQITLSFTHNEDIVIVPQALSAYPNPFNSFNNPLTINCDISKAKSARLNIYNIKGQLVWKADIDKKTTAMQWDGKDMQGKACASGLYQMQLTDNTGHKINRKLMLIH